MRRLDKEKEKEEKNMILSKVKIGQNKVAKESSQKLRQLIKRRKFEELVESKTGNDTMEGNEIR